MHARTSRTHATHTGANRTAAITARTAAAALIGAVALGAPALAQDGAAPLPMAEDARAARPHVIVPQRPWIPVPGQSMGAPVRAASVDVDIEIVGAVARTTMAIELRNDTRRMAEAEMVIPVPEGAAITAFGLDGLSDEPDAVLLPRDEARKIYTDIVRRMVDPGLLEFVGHGMIRSSVFPVPAKGSETFRVTYEEVLTGHGQRIDYTLLKPETGAGLSAGGPAWDIDARIIPNPRAGSLPIAAVWSPSHGIVTRLDGPNASVDVTNPAEPGAFRMSILWKAGEHPMTVLAYPDPDRAGTGYFAVLMPAPDLPENTEPMPREVTLVLDRSGSMGDGKLEQAIDAALQVVGALRDGERFNLIDYSTDARAFAHAPVEKSDESLTQFKAYLESLRAMGGTNIHDALVAALDTEPASGHLPIVLFLTDGLATQGVTSEVGIRDAVAKANAHGHRVFSFGVGDDVNAPLLSGLANTTRAAATFVRPDEDIELAVGDLFAKLDGPVLAAPTFSGTPAWADFATPRVLDVLPDPDAMPDIFVGDQTLIVGRYRDPGPGGMTLAVIGDRLGERTVYSVPFDPAEDASPMASYVPRLWAQRQIGALTDRVRALQADPDPSASNRALIEELVGDIVALSQRFGILTEYTAFLAAEEEDLRRLAGRGSFGRFDADLGDLTEAELDIRAMQSARASAAPQERSGSGAVARERQNAARARGMQLEDRLAVLDDSVMGSIALIDDDAAGRTASNVQQVAGQSFIQRRSRWIDGRVLEAERQRVLAYTERLTEARASGDPEPEAPVLVADQKPEAFDQVIAFGTDAYDALLDRFVAEGRQGLLAVRGELVLLLDHQTVLVQNPG